MYIIMNVCMYVQYVCMHVLSVSPRLPIIGLHNSYPIKNSSKYFPLAFGGCLTIFSFWEMPNNIYGVMNSAQHDDLVMLLCN